MNKVLLIVLIFFLPHSLWGQNNCNYTLEGQILDENRTPLIGATIYALEINKGEVTGSDGKFIFERLCEGTYNIQIKFLGYETKELKVTVATSQKLEIQLTLQDRILKEIVVEDHRVISDKTSTIQTLTGKSLEEARGKSLGEALLTITGVSSIQSGPAIFKPVIHGLHSQRILILNNGIRQEGQQWGAEHAPEIDPFVATSIQVIKDAGAIKYGTDALGGVVVVNPAELPTDQKLGGQIQTIASTNGRAGTLSGLLEGGIPMIKGWGWRVQGTGKKSGDMNSPDYNLTNTGFQELNYSASIGYHKEKKGIELFYSRFRSRIGILRGASVNSIEDLEKALSQEPPYFTQPFSYSIRQPRQEVSHQLIKLTMHNRKDEDLYSLQYGFQLNNREEYDVRRGVLRETPALGYLLYTHTLDLDWGTNKKTNHTRSRGLNMMIQDNNKKDGTQTLPFIPNFINLSSGLYWIEKYSIAKWNLEVGARYDFKHYQIAGFDFRNQLYKSNLNFNNVSSTAAATYQINATSTFTTSIGNAWRPPNVAELYSLGTHQSAAAIEYGLLLDELTNQVIDANKVRLKSEKAIKWVNTYRKNTTRWSTEISGYINNVFNYVYLTPRGVTQNTRGIFPYFRYTQTNALFIGGDILSAYRFNTSLSAQGRVSLLRANDRTNHDYLIFIPSNRYELSLRYDVPTLKGWTKFYIDAKIKYVDRQRRSPRVLSVGEILNAKNQGTDPFLTDDSNFDFVESPEGYTLMGLNVGISRPIKNQLLDFRISVDNLTNASYREYTNRMRYYADDIGRNLAISLKLSF